MGFSDEVGRWSDRAEDKVRLAIRKIALTAFERVIMRSPVDTGRFRGNWQVAIGSMPLGTIELDDPGGQIVMNEATAAVMKLQPGESIYLVNNLPYARRLEYGWSQQAPNGMVRLTVQEMQPVIEQVAKQLREQR